MQLWTSLCLQLYIPSGPPPPCYCRTSFLNIKLKSPTCLKPYKDFPCPKNEKGAVYGKQSPLWSAACRFLPHQLPLLRVELVRAKCQWPKRTGAALSFGGRLTLAVLCVAGWPSLSVLPPGEPIAFLLFSDYATQVSIQEKEWKRERLLFHPPAYPPPHPAPPSGWLFSPPWKMLNWK